MKVKIPLFLSLLAFLGCSEHSTDPNLKTSIVSKPTSDSLCWVVRITTRNETGDNVYFKQREDCIGFWRLEQKVGDLWQPIDKAITSYSSFYPDNKTILHPNEVLRDSIKLYQAGTYRIWFLFSFYEDWSEPDSLTPEEFVAE